VPFFTEGEKAHIDSFESYSELDALGRCGVAFANISKEIMPTEERGEIGSVKPSGWHTDNYHEYIDGNYLYNRCHLIAYMLAGENDNERNLITGTRYLNTQGMLPFEEKVSDYVKNTGNHVMYRVTPIFEGDNLVASGVLMEAYSVEDNGSGLQYNVYCYNVQPGVEINYATGENWLANVEGEVETFIVNTNSNKFHLPNCDNAASISEKNKKVVESTYQMLMKQGYSPCGQCLGKRS
jgi:DNA-entry nuclease